MNKKNKKMASKIIVGGAAVVAGAVAYGLIFKGDALYIYDKIWNKGGSPSMLPVATPTAALSPSSTSPSGYPIRRGSKGSEVRELQNALIAKYGSGILPRFGADGDFGGETESALTSKGLPISYSNRNELDRVLSQLRSSSAIPTATNSNAPFSFPAFYTDGKKYDSVLAIQRELNKRGITDFEGKRLVEDGIIGRRTGSAMAKAKFPKTSTMFIGYDVAILPVSEQDYNLFMTKMFPFSGLGAVQISTTRGTAILNLDGSVQNYAPAGLVLGTVVSASPQFYTFISAEGDAGLVQRKDVI